MKILVTGCAGFIGTNLCKRLIALGHKVIGIDHLGYGYESNVKAASIKEFYRRNIFDIPSFDGIDVIYHQANLRKNIASCMPNLDVHTTVNGTRMMLDYAVSNKIKKFVYASSSLVYGEHQDEVNEESRLNPICIYGASKVGAEAFVNMYRQHGLNTCIFRYFQGYGAYQNTSKGAAVIPAVINNILNHNDIVIYGDGQQTRSFTWIDDIVNILEMPLHGKCFGETYNVTSGKEYKIIDIINLIIECCKEIGIKIKSKIVYSDPLPDDAKHLRGNNEKIRKLGITFNTDIKTNLIETIKYYENNHTFPLS